MVERSPMSLLENRSSYIQTGIRWVLRLARTHHRRVPNQSRAAPVELRRRFLIAWPRARSPGLYASSRSTNTRPEGQSQGPGSVWETDVAEAYAVATVIESDTPQTDTHAGAVCARARVGASAPQTLARKHGLFDCANPWFSHGSWIPVSIFDRQAVR